jgi:transcriptional regulator with XRE-family HTH domain
MSRRRSFNELRAPIAADSARRARVEELRGELLAGAAIQGLREHYGLSQTRLAELLGVSQPWVSRIEDQDDVRLSTLLRILDAIGADLELRVRTRDGVELVWDDGAWHRPDAASDPAA